MTTEISEHDVLEALYRGKASIKASQTVEEGSDGPLWHFGDWNTCTCGHIYGAATGDPVLCSNERMSMKRRDKVLMGYDPDSGDPLYKATLAAIVAAFKADAGFRRRHGLDLAQIPGDVHYAVSQATSEIAMEKMSKPSDDDDDKFHRKAALLLIDNAIRHIEKRQRADMLKLKAENVGANLDVQTVEQGVKTHS